MPTVEEAKLRCIDIVNSHLKQYFKSGAITKEQFKEVNKSVCGSVAANYNGEALDKDFQARVEHLLEPKKNEVLSGSGNGAAGVTASEVGKRAREPSGEAEERPAIRQQPGGAGSQLGITAVKQEGGVAPLMPSEAHRPVKEEGGLTAPPPPPPPPPPPLNGSSQNGLQPLQRGSAPPIVTALADLRDDMEQEPTVTNFAPAVAPGTVGRQLQVHSNACAIEADGMGPNWALVVTQYDVHYSWIEVLDEKDGRRTVDKKITDLAFRPLQALFGGACAYDGGKVVYAVRKLGLGDLSEAARAAHWSVADEDGKAVFTLLLDGDQLGGLQARLQGAASAEEAARLQNQIDNVTARTVRVRQGVGESLEMRLLCSNDAMAQLGLEYRKYFAVLDLAFRLHPWLYKPVKSAYYEENISQNRRNCIQLGREPNQKLWLGYRQKIIDTVNGPMLMIDTAACAMHAPCGVLDFLVAKLPSVRNKEQLRLKDVKDAERQLTTLIDGRHPKIMSKHAKREFKLISIDDKPADERLFFDDAAGRERTVAEYFKEKYPQHRLQYPHLPCVDVKKKGSNKPVLIPIELLSLIGGEPLKMTPSIQAEMVMQTSKEPEVRFKEIDQIVVDRAPGGTAADACPAAAFGLSTKRERMVVAGRQLLSPKLLYKCHQTRQDKVVDVQTHDGSWKMVVNGKDVGFTEPGTPPRAWAVLNFAPNLRERECEQFLEKFMNVARDRGIDLGRQLPPVVTMEPPRDLKTAGKVMEERLQKKLGDRYAELDLVVCVLPEVKNLYEAVKRWSEATTGIAVQCCKALKIMGDGGRAKPLGTSPQYHAGLMLKLNLKLGGGNVQMAPEQRNRGAGLALMADRPTMVCGVDVYHPPPGSYQPSWVALVASLDRHCRKWHTIVDIQESRQEQIGAAASPAAGQAEGFDLLKHMRTCLKEFYNVTATHPARIIFYRDGVAHNQFEFVMTQEIAAISRVLAEQGLEGTCELIFVVAQKKTNARFAATKEEGGTFPSGSSYGKGKGGKGGRDFGGKGKGGGGSTVLGNVPCGTVVDTAITDRNTFNFYLTSQHGLKGTCRPTHYHVLACPPTLTADALQQFTFDLCHIYARCTKIASLPAPLYYAHLAASHSPWYEKDGFREVSDTWEHGSTSSGGSRGSEKSKSNYEPLHEKQASRLYYC